MDIKPFYELRNRLYATASAGCSAINEDFRLKRAVEGFQPLSSANKVFGKLYAMCEKLFENNSSAMLADCIALADALAVTQGTFNVSDEIEPYTNITATRPVNMYYSEYNGILETLKNPTKFVNLRNIRDNQLRFIYDPRFLSVFIEKLNSGTTSEYFSDFAYSVCRSYGKEIIPILKQSLNTSDQKANGLAVKFVSDIAEAEENEWYLELAFNEEIPSGIRENAVKALAYLPENADKLMELYRTQKGKVKNSALYSLAVISPPEAEPIWQKIIKNPEKISGANKQFISLSGSKTFLDFADKYVEMYAKKLRNADRTQIYMLSTEFNSGVRMFSNKPDAEEYILKAIKLEKDLVKAKKFSETTAFNNILSMMMINNVLNHPDEPKFREIATHLYEYDKNNFLPSEFFIRLTENPDTAFSMLSGISPEQHLRILDIIGNIWYSYPEKKYYINKDISYSNYRGDCVPVFEHIPESMLEFLADRKIFTRNNENTTALKILENLGVKSKTENEILSDICHSVSRILNNFLQDENCNPNDIELIKKHTCDFVFEMAHKCPSTHAVDIIVKNFRNEPQEKYKDIVYDLLAMMFKASSQNSRTVYFAVSWYLKYIDEIPLSDSEKYDELLRIEKLALYTFRDSKYANNMKRELDYLKEYVKKYSKKGNN